MDAGARWVAGRARARKGSCARKGVCFKNRWGLGLCVFLCGCCLLMGVGKGMMLSNSIIVLVQIKAFFWYAIQGDGLKGLMT